MITIEDEHSVLKDDTQKLKKKAGSAVYVSTAECPAL
jgi:hypothetical protein